MSKAFTKEEGDAAAPLVVPTRAPLPAGADNYVTPRGLANLRAEQGTLEAERIRLESDPETPDRARALQVVGARHLELAERVGSAQVVDPRSHAADEVREIRFGARVTVRTGAGEERHYQIVGVDEADAAHGRVAFVSPLARALLGRTVGETAPVHTPRGDEDLEVLAIDYDEA